MRGNSILSITASAPAGNRSHTQIRVDEEGLLRTYLQSLKIRHRENTGMSSASPTSDCKVTTVCRPE